MNPQKKSAIFSAVFYTIFTSCYFVWQSGFLHGICLGVFSGIIFGFLMYWFTKWVQANRYMQVDIPGKDEAIFSGPANHFKGWEGVGGQLFLFNDKLYFKSHRVNFQRHGWQISLQQINDVQLYDVLGLAKNGLKVITTDGTIEKFVVNNREEWQSAILAAKALTA